MICEVLATPDEVRAPRLSSRQLANGSMVSMPLEDLWPFLDRREIHGKHDHSALGSRVFVTLKQPVDA